MVTEILALIAFFVPLYLLSEIYYLIKVKKTNKFTLIKLAICGLSIVFAYSMLSVAQTHMLLVYLASTVLVVSIVLFIIKIFSIRVK
jgi:hypothetical protein